VTRLMPRTPTGALSGTSPTELASMRREITLARVLLIYALGLIAGIQGALYLYDTFDDGMSEPLSGVIALVFVAVGLCAIGIAFRGPRATEPPRP